MWGDIVGLLTPIQSYSDYHSVSCCGDSAPPTKSRHFDTCYKARQDTDSAKACEKGS
ncbi:predicted protein [Botrytis cinerea T4]|uniref:Uncharacterized protein n=1 Tax=Botryotinia fuckeliana (strain T4) TaxID=999810 RepID=G2XQ07_BOTF4|nr:predicted protein [Botrytis cinerea T4]